MCGICGVLNFDLQKVEKGDLQRMCQTLAHRGPDAEGYHLENNIGLGHRRLSIIDLETGNQPIHNENKTVWLITNGEIYNFKELRQMLQNKGHQFATQTDAEVIVHLYEDYSEDCLQYLRGMFALAIWDGTQKKLFLARDRVGKKPLCYFYDGRRFIFASEIKAILQVPGVKREIDFEALNLYLSLQYVPSPWTMFKNIKKLPPAHYLLIKNKEVLVNKYWQLEVKTSPRLKQEEYEEGIRENLDEAVRLRLVSDVPVGAFLSGGLDSSIIVGLMSKHLTSPVKTFSVGFAEKLYNELTYSRIVAKKFNAEHQELLLRPKIMEILPKIVKYFDEPFADYSCIPTYYMAQFAAQKVKVVLNGDGGDESFAGYLRYNACKLAGYFDLIPAFLKKLILTSIYFIPKSSDIRMTNWQLKRFFRSLGLSPQRRYLNWISAFNSQEKKMLCHGSIIKDVNLGKEYELWDNVYGQNQGINFVESTIKVDIQTYLPNDLLVKMDMATMANSLEARSPFLDHKFMEYAAAIPVDLKLKNFINKYILKKTYENFLPRAIWQRKKMGFGIPIGQWFREELKDFLQDTLFDKKATGREYFNKDFITGIIKEHMQGDTDNGYKLWTLLMFELWFREYID